MSAEHQQALSEADQYAAEAEVPMHLLTEQLVRKMLRNAYAAGLNQGLDIAHELIKKHELTLG